MCLTCLIHTYCLVFNELHVVFMKYVHSYVQAQNCFHPATAILDNEVKMLFSGIFSCLKQNIVDITHCNCKVRSLFKTSKSYCEYWTSPLTYQIQVNSYVQYRSCFHLLRITLCTNTLALFAHT